VAHWQLAPLPKALAVLSVQASEEPLAELLAEVLTEALLMESLLAEALEVPA